MERTGKAGLGGSNLDNAACYDRRLGLKERGAHQSAHWRWTLLRHGLSPEDFREEATLSRARYEAYAQYTPAFPPVSGDLSKTGARVVYAPLDGAGTLRRADALAASCPPLAMECYRQRRSALAMMAKLGIFFGTGKEASAVHKAMCADVHSRRAAEQLIEIFRAQLGISLGYLRVVDDGDGSV